MSKFIVTRQSYFFATEDDPVAVEIALDDAQTWNAGALAERYEHDFFTSDDPREIVDAAIRLRTAWRKDLKRDQAIVFTFSFNDLCYPSLYEEDTIYDLSRWAEKKWAEMPKCDQCGGLLNGNDYKLIDDWDLGSFCSDACAEAAELEYHRDLPPELCPHRDDCIFHSPPDIATCGNCGLSWDDAIVTSWTPAPSGRCPFEYFHEYEPETDECVLLDPSAIPSDFPVQPIDPEENE